MRIPRDADQCSELMSISFTVVVRNADRHRIGTAAQGRPWRLMDSTGKWRFPPVATDEADHAQVERGSAAPFPRIEPASDRPQLFHLAENRTDAITCGYGVPRGIRTPVTAVKGRCPRPG